MRTKREALVLVLLVECFTVISQAGKKFIVVNCPLVFRATTPETTNMVLNRSTTALSQIYTRKQT